MPGVFMVVDGLRADSRFALPDCARTAPEAASLQIGKGFVFVQESASYTYDVCKREADVAGLEQ